MRVYKQWKASLHQRVCENVFKFFNITTETCAWNTLCVVCKKKFSPNSAFDNGYHNEKWLWEVKEKWKIFWEAPIAILSLEKLGITWNKIELSIASKSDGRCWWWEVIANVSATPAISKLGPNAKDFSFQAFNHSVMIPFKCLFSLQTVVVKPQRRDACKGVEPQLGFSHQYCLWGTWSSLYGRFCYFRL